MGIYDRDYYRNEGPSYLGSLMPSGIVCKWLIGLNVGFFLLQMVTRNWPGGGIQEWLWLQPNLVLEGQIWRLLTYAFLHDTTTLFHLLFNMLFLWWFGSDLEALYGPREFAFFYLTSAVIGGLGHVVYHVMQGSTHVPCLGASGAVSALLVLCALHFPTRIIWLFLFLPVPIWLLAVFHVVGDAFELLGGRHTTTAVSVHLAGAAFAALYYQFHLHLSGVLDLFKRRRYRAKPNLRIYQPESDKEPVSVPVGGPDLDEHLEAKLDAVLEKVARFGQASLTDNERKILLRASEIYKRRRT